MIAVGELDGLLSSQNSLIKKLKEECCKLGAKLEESTENSRSLFPHSLSYIFIITFYFLIIFSSLSFVLSLSCLPLLPAGHPYHHFTNHHLFRLFGRTASTRYNTAFQSDLFSC